MNTERTNWIMGVTLLTAAPWALLVSAAEGEEIKIVSPSPWADMEAAGGTGKSAPTGRAQQIFPAADFMGLPVGNRLLTAVAFRPDGNYEGPAERIGFDCLVRFSTTEKEVGRLSATYAKNWGDDLTTVLEGDLAYHTTHSGPVGGPKEFYSPVPLQTPFVYDPSGGNLLLDMLWRGSQDTGTASFDFIEDTNQNFTQHIWGSDPDSVRREYTTGGVILEFTFGPEPGIRGDYNGDGELDAGDLDLQAAVGIATQDLTYDLNGDGVVDYAGDRVMWLHELKNVYVGDANLDSEFNSNDFVQVFQAGKYETALSAGWAEGDWDASRTFGSSDFIVAFQDGGYELGPRTDAAVVPEPAAWTLLVNGVVFWLFGRRTCAN